MFSGNKSAPYILAVDAKHIFFASVFEVLDYFMGMAKSEVISAIHDVATNPVTRQVFAAGLDSDGKAAIAVTSHIFDKPEYVCKCKMGSVSC